MATFGNPADWLTKMAQQKAARYKMATAQQTAHNSAARVQETAEKDKAMLQFKQIQEQRQQEELWRKEYHDQQTQARQALVTRMRASEQQAREAQREMQTFVSLHNSYKTALKTGGPNAAAKQFAADQNVAGATAATIALWEKSPYKNKTFTSPQELQKAITDFTSVADTNPMAKDVQANFSRLSQAEKEKVRLFVGQYAQAPPEKRQQIVQQLDQVVVAQNQYAGAVAANGGHPPSDEQLMGVVQQKYGNLKPMSADDVEKELGKNGSFDDFVNKKRGGTGSTDSQGKKVVAPSEFGGYFTDSKGHTSFVPAAGASQGTVKAIEDTNFKNAKTKTPKFDPQDPNSMAKARGYFEKLVNEPPKLPKALQPKAKTPGGGATQGAAPPPQRKAGVVPKSLPTDSKGNTKMPPHPITIPIPLPIPGGSTYNLPIPIAIPGTQETK